MPDLYLPAKNASGFTAADSAETKPPSIPPWSPIPGRCSSKSPARLTSRLAAQYWLRLIGAVVQQLAGIPNNKRNRHGAGPAQYRWSSFRQNASGRPCEHLKAHPLSLSIEQDVEARRAAYLPLSEQTGQETISDIRLVIAQGLPFGAICWNVRPDPDRCVNGGWRHENQ